jgi:hypothetical protein
MTITIDQKIGAALSSANVTAPAIAALLFEVEKALADAEQNAVATRKASLDPIAFQDAASARASVEIATLTVDRLRAAQSQLIKRYTEVETAEALSRWQADRDRVEKLRDQAAAEFSKCRALIEQIAIIFSNTEAVAKECSRVNGASPPGQRHIQGPELTARHLAGFSASDPSVLKSTVLFWDGKQIWPPPQKPISVLMASPPQHDARFSSDWHAARSGTDQKDQPNANQKMADYYASLTKEQDERRRQEDLADRLAKRSA